MGKLENEHLKVHNKRLSAELRGYDFIRVEPKQGTYVVLSSDDWRMFNGHTWEEMSVEDQIEASK